MKASDNKQRLNEIYVVGCGQSLDGFNWTLLQDKTTIAVNGALRDVPNPDFFVTADTYFANRAAHSNFWGVDTYKVIVMQPDHPHINRVARAISKYDCHIIPVRYNGDIGFSELDFCTGQNSGFCGMQLAVVLKAKVIHLLGMDFCGSGVKGNYHGMYPSNQNVWDEFFFNFKIAIEKLREYDIEVISHSSISRLNGIVEYRKLYG